MPADNPTDFAALEPFFQIIRKDAVHGRAVGTGRAYDNHFVSVITVKDRRVTHWRDYLDPVSVFQAIGWPTEDH